MKHKRKYQFLTMLPFSIMLVLGDGSRHGYEIMKQISLDTDDRVRVRPGALYGAIKQLLDDGYIEEATPIQEISLRKRRYYQLTDKGNSRLREELKQLDATVGVAKQRLRLAVSIQV
jgi:DNA-binding PadR family transcriptional regulator